MRKEIKKWGDSFIITISREDMKVYELNRGDIVDIELVKLKLFERRDNRQDGKNRTATTKDNSATNKVGKLEN